MIITTTTIISFRRPEERLIAKSFRAAHKGEKWVEHITSQYWIFRREDTMTTTEETNE